MVFELAPRQIATSKSVAIAVAIKVPEAAVVALPETRAGEIASVRSIAKNMREARGADPLQAAVWGVFIHARAGEVLARRVAPLGFLARELLQEIPRLVARSGR